MPTPRGEILAILQAKSRDNGRTPVQWNAGHQPDHPRIFAYPRRYQNERLLVVSNLCGEEALFEPPAGLHAGSSRGKVLLSNYAGSPAPVQPLSLWPYESIASHFVG